MTCVEDVKTKICIPPMIWSGSQLLGHTLLISLQGFIGNTFISFVYSSVVAAFLMQSCFKYILKYVRMYFSTNSFEIWRSRNCLTIANFCLMISLLSLRNAFKMPNESIHNSCISPFAESPLQNNKMSAQLSFSH